jgi:Cu-Zn family superoxide dismutase
MSHLTGKARRRALLAGLLAAAAFSVASPAGAGNGNSTVIGTGPDYVYVAGALSGSNATVSAGSLGSGNSQITLTVERVNAPAGTKFGAHVHVNPCGTAGADAGAHYAAAVDNGPLKNTEVWLDFSVDANGRGHATATRQFEITNRAARSVIIHVMGTDHETGIAGARLACIDLDA